jgi:glycosyltransferase involved in cell wall biosynthesis
MTDTHLVVLCLEWPSPTRHVGGVGRYAFRLTRWLSSRTQVSVVTGPDPSPLPGVTLHPVDARLFSNRAGRYYGAPLEAAKLVRGLQPDVVHAHGDEAALAYWPGSPPIIRTYYGRAAGEARSGRWQRRANHVVLAAVEHAGRRRVRVAVGIGPDSALAYKTDATIPPVLPEDLPASIGQRAAVPTVVFVGGFEGRKRGALAAQVVHGLRRKYDHIQLTVFGPERDRERYPPWVDFRSKATDGDVRAALAEAWILLAPSTYEGFGIPAWEAMGAGAVVVGTPSPGLRFLAAGDCAVVVEDGELQDTVEALIADEAGSTARRKRARVRAEEIARMADPERYLALLTAVS